MTNIGAFAADKDDFTGTLRTLMLNVNVIPYDEGSESARTSASRRPATTWVRHGRRLGRPGGLRRRK